MILTGEAMVACLVAMFVAPGRGAYGGDNPAMHRPRLAFEWALGQHITVLDGERLAGWAAWYRVDDETLASLARGEADDWVRQRRYPVLNAGPHCYVADVIVAPSAPQATYRTLIDLVGATNADAESFSGHLLKRDGRERFAIRYNHGETDWWRRRQSESRLH